MQGYQTDEIRLQETFPAAWTLIWLVCDQGYDSLSNFSSKRVVSHCAGGRLLAQSEEGAAYRAHLETSVDYVSGWDGREEQSSSVLRLQNGLALLAARDDPRYEAWRKAAGLQLQRNAPLYVQFDTETKSIRVLYLSLSRTVESVEIGSNGRATVTFLRAPSFYFVNMGQPGSQKMIALLQQSARDHQTILVVSHPSKLEILDVRSPMQ